MSTIPTLFIPTLDISNGKAVIIKNGNVDRCLGDALEKAQFLSITKNFQLTDVDRAKGLGDNREIIKAITTLYPCYVGGGIRTYEDAYEMINSNARRVVISTAASELIDKLPKERIILGIDIDETMHVLTHGRNLATDKTVFDYLDLYQTKVEMISVTFHHTEGCIKGIPIDMIKKIKDHITNPKIKLVCAGGIQSIGEIQTLMEYGVTPQFGAGFWNGKFTLGEVFRTVLTSVTHDAWLTTKTMEPLLPCIIQNVHGAVLGHSYCTLEAIRLSVDMRMATFYSRERDGLLIQGATTGNFHKVLSMHLSCDASCVRMVVDGNGKPFCHLDRESCFGHCDPARGSMKTLQYHINDRMVDPHSYLSHLVEDKKLIETKILEESQELVSSQSKDTLIQKASDLLFYTTLYLTTQQISVEVVEKELLKRKYTKFSSAPDVSKPDTGLRIGIIVNSSNSESVLNYLSLVFKTSINKVDTSDRNFLYESDNPNLHVVPIKAEDIPILINRQIIDGIVSYEDTIMNYDVDVKKIDLTHRGAKVTLVVAAREDVDLATLKRISKSRKIVIMTEYLKLASEWSTKNKLNTSIIFINGDSKAYLANDLCDVCICASYTGKTLKDNKLRIVESLITTHVALFASSALVGKFEDVIGALD